MVRNLSLGTRNTSRNRPAPPPPPPAEPAADAPADGPGSEVALSGEIVTGAEQEAQAQGELFAWDEDHMLAVPFKEEHASGRRQPPLLPSQFPDPDTEVDVDLESPLSQAEENLRSWCDQGIREHAAAEVVFVISLKLYLNRKLYRDRYANAEEFCDAELNRSRPWAYLQFDRLAVHNVLSPAGRQLPPAGITRPAVKLLRAKGPQALTAAVQRVAGEDFDPVAPGARWPQRKDLEDVIEQHFPTAGSDELAAQRAKTQRAPRRLSAEILAQECQALLDRIAAVRPTVLAEAERSPERTQLALTSAREALQGAQELLAPQE